MSQETLAGMACNESFRGEGGQDVTKVPFTRTRFGGSGSLVGRSRRLFLLPPAALFLFLLAFQLHRSIRSLPPVCPPFDSKPESVNTRQPSA